MKLLSQALVHLALLQSAIAQHLQDPHFPGYGFKWYDVVCGHACTSAISGAMLECSVMDHSHGHSHGAGPTTPQCRANDTPYLTTLAYCMNSTCDPVTVPTWQREKFWADHLTGDPTVLPKWGYTRALTEVKSAPTVTYNASAKQTLNQTLLVAKASYNMQANFMTLFDRIESLQARYAIVLVTIGFGTPVLLTLLGRLPFMTMVFDRIKPYIVYPSVLGTYHVRPLPWLLGNAPTVGQALYIFMFFALNLILSCVNYDRSQPHPWYFPPKEELLAYIGYRTGHIGYALLPLLILFSGRNNFLLWVTNWSHGTYLLLHRWVARIFALHAIVHSITLLITYKGTGSYPTESKAPYWLWGIVATVLTCAMLIFSHLYFRRWSYEVFLVGHIVMTVFVIAGCWYHVILKWGFNFYDNWLYAACAVWFFDRLVRVLRVMKNGVRRANVTEVGSDHVRIDIEGLRFPSHRPGYVAYVYFPTLSPLKPWENHPFSVNGTSMFRNYQHVSRTTDGTTGDSSSSDYDSHGVVEKPVPESSVRDKSVGTIASAQVGTAGITLIVRRKTGLTKLLRSHHRLLTLVDGPYPQHPSASILECDRVVLIGGGIGITGLLSWIQAHPNLRLAWSVKAAHEPLVREVQVVLEKVTEKEILVGDRLDVERVIRSEAERGYKKVGVVVCGPDSMCDAVRATVAGLGRGRGTVFDLDVHAFSW